jgi:malate/lactate dehydrogenase
VDGALATLTGAQAAAAEEYVRTWYVRHVALDSGRSSTWTSGLGVARMVAALVRPELAIWPASLVLDGEYGIADVAVSVPVTLGPGGAEEIHEWELAADDLSALRGSAELVREVAAGIDGPVATGA